MKRHGHNLEGHGQKEMKIIANGLVEDIQELAPAPVLDLVHDCPHGLVQPQERSCARPRSTVLQAKATLENRLRRLGAAPIATASLREFPGPAIIAEAALAAENPAVKAKRMEDAGEERVAYRQ